MIARRYADDEAREEGDSDHKRGLLSSSESVATDEEVEVRSFCLYLRPP